MEVQIFGVKKSADTRKALRFFAERRIKTHFVDLNERAASPGELKRFVETLWYRPIARSRLSSLRGAWAALCPPVGRAVGGTTCRRAVAAGVAARSDGNLSPSGLAEQDWKVWTAK